MKLRDVTFERWIATSAHAGKPSRERWRRELYPWPVIADVDYSEDLVGIPQHIRHDGADYLVTLRGTRYQPDRGTWVYSIHVACDGLGWNARSYDDPFSVLASPDGRFVTLFRRGNDPLEKLGRAFFARRWEAVDAALAQTLSASRYLSAALIGEMLEDAYGHRELLSPTSSLTHSASPLFVSKDGDLWLGYRYFSKDAYIWARRHASKTSQLRALYIADTKYQFRTDLPEGAHVQSANVFDRDMLQGRYAELITVLQRRVELPTRRQGDARMPMILAGEVAAEPVAVGEGDVHEALTGIHIPCHTKADLRYCLACAVVLNVWIEEERRAGFRGRKKFYAFKRRVAELTRWAQSADLEGVLTWYERGADHVSPLMCFRIDDVDFTFDAIPIPDGTSPSSGSLAWRGVRLKPIAPLVLTWAKTLRDAGST
jgi:hypothetical protein